MEHPTDQVTFKLRHRRKEEIMHDQIFRRLIGELKEEGRYRIFRTLERFIGEYPEANWITEDGETRRVVVWCGNDYLGMGHHPKVISAMREAIDSHGAGSGGTRNISGTHSDLVHLEGELADLVGKESALAFGSGYVANETALSTLGRCLPDCVILSDAGNHASMIEGMRLSKVERKIFRHNDFTHLEELLAEVPSSSSKIVAFESVYSMDGDIAPIGTICEVAHRYGALTYLDETHAVGLYGSRGGGLAQEQGVSDQVDVIQGGFGKGFGVVGGFVAGSSPAMDVIRSFGCGFIFTTSIPPSIAAGVLASVKHLKSSSSERMQHRRIVSLTKEKLREAALPLLETTSHIIPVMIGDSVTCQAISDYLLEEEGVYIQPINYPTVPRGTERLRITPSPLHTEKQIGQMVQALRRAFNKISGHRVAA